MKYLSISILVNLISLFSYSQGISFSRSPNFDSLSVQAADSNNILFVYVYTTWCGPCKWMDKVVFTNLEVKDFFNNHFVNAKYDAERGEGSIVAEKYQVSEYPTYLFLKDGSKLLIKQAGLLDSKSFLELGILAIQKAQVENP